MTLEEKYDVYIEFRKKFDKYCAEHICGRYAPPMWWCSERCGLSKCAGQNFFCDIDFDTFEKIMEYETQIDWSKVPVDTKIYVRDSKFGRWVPRHFAKYKNDKVYAFENGCTSFSGVNNSLTTWKYAKLAEGEDDK